MFFEELRRAVQSAHEQGENITLSVDGMPFVAFQHHNSTLSIQLLGSPGQQIALTQVTFDASGLQRARPADFSARFFHQEAV